jgi:hypothetical protein
MTIQRRRIAVAATLAALAVLATNRPSADLQLITHDVRDSAPHKVQAAVDLGVVAVSVLYTWSTTPLVR